MKKFLKIAGIVVGALVLIIILLAIFGGNDATVEKGKSEPVKEKKDTTYKIGDTVSSNGWKVKITKAEFTKPAQYAAPETKGAKVLTLDVVAINNSDDQVMIDNTEFALYDKNGKKLKEYFGYDEMAISDTVNKGKELDGKLFYEAPEADKYELIYTPSFSFNGDTELKFNIVPGTKAK